MTTPVASRSVGLTKSRVDLGGCGFGRDRGVRQRAGARVACACRREPIQIRALDRYLAPITGRHRETQHLPDAVAGNPEMTRRLTRAHPLGASQADLAINIHGEYAPALPVARKGQKWPTFTPAAAGSSRRYRGRLSHRRSQMHVEQPVGCCWNRRSDAVEYARWTLKVGGKVRHRPDGAPLPMIAVPVFGYSFLTGQKPASTRHVPHNSPGVDGFRGVAACAERTR